MKTVKFKNSELTEQLLEEGKVVFPLLLSEDIIALNDLFAKTHPEIPNGFYSTTHVEDKSWRKEVSDEILKVLNKRLDGQFDNIHVLGGAFISKAPGEKGILPLHQDWNIVDEKEARSYNLWVPLCDVNSFNGAMRILEKSHRKQETYRGPNLPPVLYQISNEVDAHMTSLDMKAGEAVLYDHALWHSSPVNQSSEARVAVVFGVVPENVEMKFYHQNEEKVEEYISHPNFFFENDPKEGPKGLRLNRNFNFLPKQLSKEEFEEVYLDKRKEKKHWFFSIFRK